MTDPRGPEWSDPTRAANGYPPNTDPAYSGYWGPTYYGSGYGAPGYVGSAGSPMAQPTEQLPQYWQPGTGYPVAPPPPPPPPPPKKSPRWLWAAAVAAVVLVTGLVLALVIVSNSSKQSTVVQPATSTPAFPQPTTLPSRPRTPTNTMPPIPLPIPLPIPTEAPGPTEPGAPSSEPPATGTQSVVYTVSGEGRAINITYVDTGGIMQIEFNVALPWSKEVSLAAPARNSASVAVVNVGRDVTCSVTVDGTPVRQRSGRGLTICTGLS